MGIPTYRGVSDGDPNVRGNSDGDPNVMGENSDVGGAYQTDYKMIQVKRVHSFQFN